MPTFLIPTRKPETFHPRATYAIAAVTILAYALETLLGGSTEPGVLLRLGASQHDLVWRQHQLYRLLCPAFLHIGLLHLFANGWAFFQLAPFVERVWGSARLVIVYVLTAIGGCLASSLFGHNLAAGASGAVFGLIGFLIAAGRSGKQREQVRELVRSYFGQSLLFWSGFNLWWGFQPGSHVDNLGHLGGLGVGLALGGVVTGVVVASPRAKLAAGACVSAVALSFLACAVFGAKLDAMSLIADARPEAAFDVAFEKARQAHATGDFQTSAVLCERAIALEPNEPRVPFVLELEGIALAKANRPAEARDAFERSWKVHPRARPAQALCELAFIASDTKSALAWGERSVRSEGGTVQTLVALGDALERTGELAPALDAYGRARKLAAELRQPSGDIDARIAAVTSRVPTSK